MLLTAAFSDSITLEVTPGKSGVSELIRSERLLGITTTHQEREGGFMAPPPWDPEAIRTPRRIGKQNLKRSRRRLVSPGRSVVLIWDKRISRRELMSSFGRSERNARCMWIVGTV